MRSYTGCLTCKRRKLKCDETKPTCGNCSKASRDCKFGERSIFRDQMTGSTPARKRRRRSSLPSEFHPETIEAMHRIRPPTKLTFIQVKDPWDPNDDEAQENHSTAAAELGTATNTDLCESSPVQTLTGDANIGFKFRTERREGCDLRLSGDALVSYLLRHFKEGPGQWLDLFDTSAYFSSKVPVMAASKPLLKAAICALSARHLWHLSRKTALDAESPGQGLMHQKHPDAHAEAWQYTSAEYYQQALEYLKATLEPAQFASDGLDKKVILAAVSILCAFELMDAPGRAWRAHLGALPLFSDQETSPSGASPVVIPRVGVDGPIFWSLARQDLLCAFISETRTRLDLTDMRLWQNAGLFTNEWGEIIPSSPGSTTGNQDCSDFEEDKKSNELIWILGKIANHLTSGDGWNNSENTLPAHARLPIGLSQQHLLQCWTLLMKDLDTWHDSLPATFTPTARTRKMGQPQPGTGQSFNTFDQIWFDLPLCAATMQSYHQAKILLLVNEPQESTALRSTVSARLRSYRQALRESIHHAREICGISLANPSEAFRVNSVQALFVAGQVLEERNEQDAVLELLRGIEIDLGWTTRYHISKLTDEWARGREINHVGRSAEDRDRQWRIS